MRKYFLLTLLAVFAFIAIGNAAANEAKPMKVVFIQADDLGWSDTELDGSFTLSTPAVSGNKLFIRTGEYLYSISKG